MSPTEVIDRQLAMAESEDAGLEQQIIDLQKQLDDIQEQRRGAALKLSIIKSIQAEIDQNDQSELSRNGNHQAAKTSNPADFRGLKASPAILKLLEQRSDLRLPDIIDNLEHQIDSASGNKRHIIRTCVSQLVTSKKIRREEDGRYTRIK